MKIKYQPTVGGHRVTVPYFAAGPEVDADGNRTGSEFRTWTAGEERDVPDDLRVQFNVSNNAFFVREGRAEQQDVGRGGTVRSVRAIDALLSIGPEFVDAATGKNPDFVCVECGQETREIYFQDPKLVPAGYGDHRDGLETRVFYTTDGTVNGEKLCPRDFLARNPVHIAWHESLGADREVTREARRRSDDARIKAEQNAREQAQSGGQRADVKQAAQPQATTEGEPNA